MRKNMFEIQTNVLRLAILKLRTKSFKPIHFSIFPRVYGLIESLPHDSTNDFITSW